MIFSVPTKLDKKIKTCFKESKVCSGKPYTFLLYNCLNLDGLKTLIPKNYRISQYIRTKI